MGVLEGALIVSALASTAGAYTSYKSGERQEEEAKKTQAAATRAQAEQEELALQEKKKSSKELAEAQSRLVRGTSGRTGLLTGTELGTDTLKTTLG